VQLVLQFHGDVPTDKDQVHITVMDSDAGADDFIGKIVKPLSFFTAENKEDKDKPEDGIVLKCAEGKEFRGRLIFDYAWDAKKRQLTLTIKACKSLYDPNLSADAENDSTTVYISVALVICYFLTGILFYTQYCKWTFIDALYFCV
jgi:hypothetical protein